MAQTSILTARHLPTALNNRQIMRGYMSVPIDKEQAKEIAPDIADSFDKEGITRIVSSELKRGVESAKQVESYMQGDPKLEQREDLRTWDIGDWAGKPKDEIIPKMKQYMRNDEEVVPGGESFGNFMARLRSVMMDEMERAQEDTKEKTALILHGNEMWHMLSALRGSKPVTFNYSAPAPGSVRRLTLTDGKYKLERVGSDPDIAV